MTWPLEYDFCSRCKEHAEFELVPDEGWLSTCCYAKPMATDVEFDDFDTEQQSDEVGDSYLSTGGERLP